MIKVLIIGLLAFLLQGSLAGKSKKSGKVVELTSANFDAKVLNGDTELKVVSFTAPWCGHCKALKPEYKQAAKDLGAGGIKLYNVDATVHQDLAQRFQIQGYPTIKMFPPKARRDGEAKDYMGGRDAKGIVQYLEAQFVQMGGKIQIDLQELTSQSMFEELCNAKDEKCIITFLPHLLDDKVKGRKEKLDILEKAGREARTFNWLWVQAGDQPKFEEQYHLTAGFPAVIMVRRSAGEYLAYKETSGKFNVNTLIAFATSMKSVNKAIKGKFPTVNKVKKWDGKSEAEAIVEDDDDFDLDAFLAED